MLALVALLLPSPASALWDNTTWRWQGWDAAYQGYDNYARWGMRTPNTNASQPDPLKWTGIEPEAPPEYGGFTTPPSITFYDATLGTTTNIDPDGGHFNPPSQGVGNNPPGYWMIQSNISNNIAGVMDIFLPVPYGNLGIYNVVIGIAWKDQSTGSGNNADSAGDPPDIYWHPFVDSQNPPGGPPYDADYETHWNDDTENRTPDLNVFRFHIGELDPSTYDFVNGGIHILVFDPYTGYNTGIYPGDGNGNVVGATPLSGTSAGSKVVGVVVYASEAPEPSSMLLLLAGGGYFAARRRRRRRGDIAA